MTTMTIGALSRRTGVRVKTLRAYEDLGLIYNVGRSPGNYRLFGEEALWCVEMVTGLRKLGLTLAEIQELSEVYLHRDEPLGPRLADLLAAVRTRTETRIAEFRYRVECIDQLERDHAPELAGHAEMPDDRRGYRLKGLDSPPGGRPYGADMRRIGPIGTWSRVVLGAGLVVVGSLGTIRPSGVAWYQVVAGLVALPVLMVGFGLVVGHYRSRPLRLTGPLGTGINCAVIIALSTNHVTGPPVEIFYGASLLAAAWRGQPGCEATVISNLLLGRDDQVGCPLLSPIDHAERRRGQYVGPLLAEHDGTVVVDVGGGVDQSTAGELEQPVSAQRPKKAATPTAPPGRLTARRPQS